MAGILFVWQAYCLYDRHLVYMVGIKLVWKASFLYGRHLVMADEIKNDHFRPRLRFLGVM